MDAPRQVVLKVVSDELGYKVLNAMGETVVRHNMLPDAIGLAVRHVDDWLGHGDEIVIDVSQVGKNHGPKSGIGNL
ncbi:MAG: hypothetical protein KIT11_05375 [Fimbriimonadaceae bacterium]|nr:hypothetical protein [Fimbriimonadaceae bacterium]QYK56677.1 MAG: hypothetical protein KF733_04145 [Fimbriimonadaceae bacterium]